MDNFDIILNEKIVARMYAIERIASTSFLLWKIENFIVLFIVFMTLGVFTLLEDLSTVTKHLYLTNWPFSRFSWNRCQIYLNFMTLFIILRLLLRHYLLPNSIDHFGKWPFPSVHFDDLNTKDDFIHHFNAKIGSYCVFHSQLCWFSSNPCWELQWFHLNLFIRGSECQGWPSFFKF